MSMNEDSDRPDLQSRDYPIREDMNYQLKVWRFERFGWYLLVLLMILGLAGLFSRGFAIIERNGKISIIAREN